MARVARSNPGSDHVGDELLQLRSVPFPKEGDVTMTTWRTLALVTGVTCFAFLGAYTTLSGPASAAILTQDQLARALGGQTGCNANTNMDQACTTEAPPGSRSCANDAALCTGVPGAGGTITVCAYANLPTQHICVTSDQHHNCLQADSGQCGTQYLGVPAMDGSCPSCGTATSCGSGGHTTSSVHGC
jgi:hypothetical protein